MSIAEWGVDLGTSLLGIAMSDPRDSTFLILIFRTMASQLHHSVPAAN